ncbi:hypothetical protein [Nocardia amamiensis]|uniref:hypothetical protein n=1 Tax=Nocardia amamiensis TaxID=404578 RepID=UPI0008368ED3|nr:hypothetical protein [Nocardia amamiensis]
MTTTLISVAAQTADDLTAVPYLTRPCRIARHDGRMVGALDERTAELADGLLGPVAEFGGRRKRR